MKILVDVSRYNNFSQAQYDLLASGIDGVIVRTGFGQSDVDVLAEIHLKNFRERGTPCIGYRWIDPIRSVQSQIDATKREMDMFNIEAEYLDMEQYFSDWSAYMDMLAGKGNPVPTFPPYILNKFYKSVYDGLSDRLIGIYSADWFVDKYCPDMRMWAFDKNYLDARYMRWYDNSWYLAKIRELGTNFTIDNVSLFAERAGIVRGIGRQFESLLPVKGLPKNLDWDVFTNDGFTKMFGVVTEPEPLPEPLPEGKDFVVNVYAVWIRETPNDQSKKVSYYWKGDRVKIYLVSGGWGKTEKGWVYLDNLSPVQNLYRATTPLFVRDVPGGKIVGYKYPTEQFPVYEFKGGWAKIAGGYVSEKYITTV